MATRRNRRRLHRSSGVLTLILVGTLHAQAEPGEAARAVHADTVPAWLYPGNSDAPNPPQAPDTIVLLQVPKSRARFTEAQTKNLFAAPDWHPDAHPAMPEVVGRGRPPALYACAYCHLPNGMGRPENASLAGLPVEYIVQQVTDMQSGLRRGLLEGYLPWKVMHAVAMNAAKEEIGTAATYFSRLPYRSRVRVIEADEVPPNREMGWLYIFDRAGATVPLGRRIVEGPSDARRHELRDDAAGFVAYVPRGSIARGRQLATKGIAGVATACVSCHGARLRGVGLIPPLAGRSPTYIVRQLLGFKNGARATAAGAPMAQLSTKLTLDEMIAVAAYLGSRRP